MRRRAPPPRPLGAIANAPTSAASNRRGLRTISARRARRGNAIKRVERWRRCDRPGSTPRRLLATRYTASRCPSPAAICSASEMGSLAVAAVARVSAIVARRACSMRIGIAALIALRRYVELATGVPDHPLHPPGGLVMHGVRMRFQCAMREPQRSRGDVARARTTGRGRRRPSCSSPWTCSRCAYSIRSGRRSVASVSSRNVPYARLLLGRALRVVSAVRDRALIDAACSGGPWSPRRPPPRAG